jgi:uroporphyrinogen decarboxylase
MNVTNCPLLDVLKGAQPYRRPIWLMRQAGRYLPEYRDVRSHAGSFLKLCYNPELACEVTLQPLRRFDLDAAILFSDILVVPHAMGLALDFQEGEGPKLQTVGDQASVMALLDGVGSDQFSKVYETVAQVKAALDPKIGFIGFCGGPWTVASYMIEGGSSKRAKALAVADANPPWFELLMSRLVETSVTYLCGQIAAGVQVVQIFDSWAGDVSAAARQRVVVDPISRIVAGVRQSYPGFPVIVFARGVADGHGWVAQWTGANAVGIEENVKLSEVLKVVAGNVAVQGNLAPDVMLQSDEVIRANVQRVLEGVPMRRHIFNLGHGITPQVRPEAVTVLVDAVREFDGRAQDV